MGASMTASVDPTRYTLCGPASCISVRFHGHPPARVANREEGGLGGRSVVRPHARPALIIRGPLIDPYDRGSPIEWAVYRGSPIVVPAAAAMLTWLSATLTWSDRTSSRLTLVDLVDRFLHVIRICETAHGLEDLTRRSTQNLVSGDGRGQASSTRFSASHRLWASRVRTLCPARGPSPQPSSRLPVSGRRRASSHGLRQG